MNILTEKGILHTSQHTDGKLEGILSISTSTDTNPFCNKMRENTGLVCSVCYAHKYLGFRKSLAANMRENYEVLTTHEFTEEEAARIPIYSFVFRFEAFGEVGNLTQAINYIRIAKTHPNVRFGWWSKRLDIVCKAFEQEGKPFNLSFVYSNPKLNTKPSVPARYKKHIDHVFSVWTKDCESKPEINCGGKKCMRCLLCYKDDTVFEINELKK